MGRESSIPVHIGHFFHIELNQLSLVTRTHCIPYPKLKTILITGPDRGAAARTAPCSCRLAERGGARADSRSGSSSHAGSVGQGP